MLGNSYPLKLSPQKHSPEDVMQIQLSDHFTYKKLFRFTIPSIIMMIFTSVYGIVDGLFVANCVGKTAFAAVNFVMPVINILGIFGYMFGAGGSALIAKTLGEGEKERASQLFSFFVYLSIGFGVVMAVLGIVFLRPIAAWMGAEGQLLEDSLLYGRVFLLSLPACILLYEFQLFFVTAEKPKLGLIVTVGAGVTNMVLDALFIVGFGWGLVGAAAASALSQVVGGIVPLAYFARPRSGSTLYLTRPIWDGKALLKCITNGSSELMSGVSMSLVGILYNVQLLRYAGEDGVAAYGILMYVSMIFFSAFLGYANGVSPVVGYHYGAKDPGELRSLLKKSCVVLLGASVAMFLLSEGLAVPVSRVFAHGDQDLVALAQQGFVVYSFAFLFAGLGIFASAFFTALNNGLVSAAISFLRVLVFELGAVLLLPLVWGVDGIWAAGVVAECMGMVVSILFWVALRKRYLSPAALPKSGA